jgi:hypothetical protein
MVGGRQSFTCRVFLSFFFFSFPTQTNLKLFTRNSIFPALKMMIDRITGAAVGDLSALLL